MTTGVSEKSYRVLWAQVVLQAKADLEHQPIGSILFNQAAAFFVSRGEWAESRAIVADCLEMHPDELCRCGERWIAERRMREGLPPEPPSSPRTKDHTPLPRLEALPGPSSLSAANRRAKSLNSDNAYRPRRTQAARAIG